MIVSYSPDTWVWNAAHSMEGVCTQMLLPQSFRIDSALTLPGLWGSLVPQASHQDGVSGTVWLLCHVSEHLVDYATSCISSILVGKASSPIDSLPARRAP